MAEPATPQRDTWNGFPKMSLMQVASAEKFREEKVLEDDLIMSSMPKGGTTWMHRILFLMRYQLDDEGREREGAQDHVMFASNMYPDFLPLERPAELVMHFGRLCYGDLVEQPRPRFFETHLFGKRFLPKELVSAGGKGKLIVVLRNLKDVLVSNHFFFGEPKDGFLGNEHGMGSLARFVSDEEGRGQQFAGGSMFDWVREQDELVRELEPEGRALVVYFEELKKDLGGQLERIAKFIETPLSPAKKAAIEAAVSFDSMKAKPIKHAGIIMRKGEIGDWQNHMMLKDWERVDAAFEKKLSDVPIAQPLRQYHAPR